MKVLLTGGYGCIGSWIARELVGRGDEVWIYDLKEDPKRLRLILEDADVRRVRFIQGDVTDLPTLRVALAANAISHVVHSVRRFNGWSTRVRRPFSVRPPPILPAHLTTTCR